MSYIECIIEWRRCNFSEILLPNNCRPQWTEWILLEDRPFCGGSGVRKFVRMCSEYGKDNKSLCVGDIEKKEDFRYINCTTNDHGSELSGLECGGVHEDGLGIKERMKVCDNPMSFYDRVCIRSSGELDTCEDDEEDEEGEKYNVDEELNEIMTKKKNKIVNSYYFQMKYLSQKYLLKTNKSFMFKKRETVSLNCSNELTTALKEFYANFTINWIFRGKDMKLKFVEKIKNLVKISQYTINGSTLILENISHSDSGVYVCVARFPTNHAKEIVVLDFMSVLVRDDTNLIKKVPGESLLIECNGLELKSILNSDDTVMVYKMIYKDKKLFLNSSVGWRNWDMHEYSLADGYLIEKMRYEHSGEYKCVMMDASTNRRWTTNLVNVLVGSYFRMDETNQIYFLVAIIMCSCYVGLVLAKFLINLKMTYLNK